MTEGPLCLSFDGLVTDELTGKRAAVSFTYTVAEDRTAWMLLEARGRRTGHELGLVTAGAIRAIHSRCFGPGGGGNAAKPSEVVNIDRSPRRVLLDRWRARRARGENQESFAAD